MERCSNFHDCGQTGHTGPSQSQCDSEYSGSTLDGLVSVSAGYQTWTVNTTGTYSSQGAGASGGSYSYSAGNGAIMMGEFMLTAGDQVTIVVGQQGLTGGQGGGGGGGTFVVLNQTTPLVIAGGGGGSHYNQGSDTARGGGVGITGPASSSTGSGYRSGLVVAGLPMDKMETTPHKADWVGIMVWSEGFKQHHQVLEVTGRMPVVALVVVEEVAGQLVQAEATMVA